MRMIGGVVAILLDRKSGITVAQPIRITCKWGENLASGRFQYNTIQRTSQPLSLYRNVDARIRVDLIRIETQAPKRKG